MAVIKDVAKLAGVSPSTVSKYLNNPQSLRPANKVAVENAIRKLRYTPNLLARNLRTQSSQTIAVIAQEISNPFHATIYSTIRKEALKENYSVVLYSINDIDGDLNSLFQSMPIHYYSGIIICYFHDMDKSFAFANNNKDIPLVIMNNDKSYAQDFCAAPKLFLDFSSGISQVAEHLIQLGMRDIAYVGCMTRHPQTEPKFSGFLRTMHQHGLEPHSVTRLQKEYTSDTGYESAQIILSMDHRPDAILVDNDIMAMGVLRCLADHSIRVPQDMMVTGFDDISMASFYCPALTTVHVPIEAVSIEAFRLLLDQIEEQTPQRIVPQFDTKLIVRETTGVLSAKPELEPRDSTGDRH